jgi:AcrR family transcriptional regulator
VAAVTDETTDEIAIRGRARVLREARMLFTAQGYAAVSMQQIADAARVNKATLYHHFRDKEDLFVAVMAEEFAGATADIAAAIARGGTLREQLRRVATQIFASFQTDFGRLLADFHEHVSERRRAELRSRGAPPWEQIRAAVERAHAAGEVRAIDPDLAARLFFGMVRSQIWWSKYDAAHPVPDEALAETIVAVLLDGISAREPRNHDGGDASGDERGVTQSDAR